MGPPPTSSLRAIQSAAAGRDDGQYRELFELSPQVLWVYDPETLRFLAVNDAAVQGYGYTREEFHTMTIADIRPKEDVAAFMDHMDAAHPGSETTGGWRHRRKDGSLIDVEVSSRVVQFGDAEARLVAVQDVSERARLDRQLESRRAQQAAVAELGVSGLEGTEVSSLMDQAVALVGRTLDAELCELLMVSDDRESFELRAGVGWDDGLVRRVSVPLGSEFHAGFTLGSLGHVVVDDYATERRFNATPLLRRHGAVSGIAVILGGRKRPIGVLAAHSRSPRQFTVDEVTFLQAVANVIAEAFGRQRAEDRVRHQALHDVLTKLPNRSLLLDRVNHWLDHEPRSDARAAVLFIDLDNFKRINDGLGHEVGDELLVAVAARLSGVLRPSDTLARVGGDEFVVLCEGIENEHQAVAIADRLLHSLEVPFDLRGKEQHVTASVGVALTAAGATAQTLLRDADAAMYRAKERGSGRYEIFDEALRERALSWIEIERELRHALEREELRNVYQPIVSSCGGELVGFETLVRWDHPERGVVSPADFIPIAEQTGLIVPLGRAVLQRACREAVRWQEADSTGKAPRVSVNLSPRQVREPNLVETVCAALEESGLDPSLLSLEMTETVLIDDSEDVREALERLAALGVRLELDDFGTGYSSLAYVKRFPIDLLKIDRSFVDGLGRESGDSAIVEAVISMARALGIGVVAEGVETEEQAALLRELGCPLAQGFLFSRPLDRDAAYALVSGRPASR